MEPFSVKLFWHLLFNKGFTSQYIKIQLEMLYFIRTRNSKLWLDIGFQGIVRAGCQAPSLTPCNTTHKDMKVDDSTAVQAHHYCIQKLLWVKIQISRNLDKLYMKYPSFTFLHVWTHPRIMHFSKAFALKLSIRFCCQRAATWLHCSQLLTQVQLLQHWWFNQHL